MLSSRRNLSLACSLSALAGYVDAIGFLRLGGMFVSFMSGNSTRMAVSLAAGQFRTAAETLGVIALFVAGAAGGSFIMLGRRRYCQSWLLLTEAALLMAAALAYGVALDSFAIAAIVLAMGLENAVFQVKDGSVHGLTYVTGALVKVGQLLAVAVAGGPRFGWLPNLLQWASLVLGAVCGALAYQRINLGAIWFAAGVALALGAATAAEIRSKH